MERSMEYRAAQANDIEAVNDLVRDAIRVMDAHRIFQWDDIYPTKEDFLEDLSCGDLYVGVQNKEIAVVYVINRKYDEEYAQGRWQFPESDFRILHRLCVNPKFQHQKVAEKTLLHIEEDLRRQKVESIRLDAFTQNPHALSLYRHHGYEEVGLIQLRKGKFYLFEKWLQEEASAS